MPEPSPAVPMPHEGHETLQMQGQCTSANCTSANCQGAAQGLADDDEYDESSEEEYSDEDELCRDECCANVDDEEKAHFLDVCWSFMHYQRDAKYDIERIQESLDLLDAHDLAIWNVDPSRYMKEITIAVQLNARFLQLMPTPEASGVDLGDEVEARKTVTTVPPQHRVTSRNSSKVRSTLRQFVRDWAAEGKAEREASYDSLTNALWRRMPARDKTGRPIRKGVGREGRTRVLCPGCGLGRLPFDLARIGYDAQGNEFSYHMLLGSHLIMNRCNQAHCHTIYPFILSNGNRKKKAEHLRAIKIPEIAPCEALPNDACLSMTAGEFVDVYKEDIAKWDALLTAFFIDTAKNIFLYIRCFASLIREGGVWINLGPLLFHYAEVENEISIELSWEEVKPAILKYFTIDEEEMRNAAYTTNAESLYLTKYNCIFFVATRNSEPVTGYSKPVFASTS